jgi:hypothetical protein
MLPSYIKNTFKLIIPLLKLSSLEQLDLSYSDNLECFLPMVNEMLQDKIKVLRVKDCSKLRCIPTLKLGFARRT